MGVFSKIHRFREAGEEANACNVSKFGVPAVSLFTTTKLFSLHHHTDITDGGGNVLYQADSRFLSLRDKTDVRRATGEQVAHIERKLLTLHERHFVSMADGSEFQLSNEMFHLISDITNIEGLGSAIDEDALAESLEGGHLAGAALDVFRTEPLPPGSPLWKTRNLLVTPHVSGIMMLPYTRDKNVALFLEDLHNYMEGKPLRGLVDRTLGY